MTLLLILTVTIQRPPPVKVKLLAPGRYRTPSLKKLKYLAANQHASVSPRPVSIGAQFEMTKYLIDVRSSAVVEDALEFWRLNASTSS
jgi:hypothetical protein